MEEQEKRQLVKDVGARVYACRTGAGMSREAMAERLGISPQYVSEIEQRNIFVPEFAWEGNRESRRRKESIVS